jgi:ribosomal protein L11 methylase PrmA
MTSSDLIINNFVIKVHGSEYSSTSDYLQPGVSIFISGIINLQKDGQGNVVSTSTFALQSFVSQRLLDK